MTKLFLVDCTAANVDFLNRILKTFNDMRLPSLPVSIIYVVCIFFSLVLDSSLLNITYFTLSKLRYLVFTESKLVSLFSHSIVQGSSLYWTLYTALLPLCVLCHFSNSLIILQTALKCLVFLWLSLSS